MPIDRDLEMVAAEVREFAKMGLLKRGVQSQAMVLNKCPTLSNLPATLKANSDRPTPRFEYLVQAIVDAIDAVDLRGHQADATVLRALFGLVDPVRRANWARRQEEAARLHGVGRDHFRRHLQQPLLTAIAEILLGGCAESGIRKNEGSLQAASAQDVLIEETIKYITDQATGEALLIELSTATIGLLIEALQSARVPAKLLVANPHVSRSAWQQERCWMTLVDRFHGIFGGYPELEVRLYDVPPSVRGRLIGDTLCLGWYTYRDDTRYIRKTRTPLRSGATTMR